MGRGVVIGAVAAGLVAVAALAWLALGQSSSESASQAALEASLLAGLTPSSLGGCSPIQGPSWAYPGDVKITSNLYEAYALNYSCGAAAFWTKKLIAEKVRNATVGSPSAIGGVPGFTCFAYPGKNGRAFAGGCGKGTSVGFGWNWNLLSQNILGATADSIIRSVGRGRYQVEIQNNSGIGTLNAFTWSPPPGLAITALTGTAGGSCQLSGGDVSCTGAIQPPRCLCRPGQNIVFSFAATGDLPTTTDGYVVTHGFVGQQIRIVAMTPIPYLIPSALGEKTPGIADLPACTHGRRSTKKHPCV
jgi:hypothetical protein